MARELLKSAEGREGRFWGGHVVQKESWRQVGLHCAWWQQLLHGSLEQARGSHQRRSHSRPETSCNVCLSQRAMPQRGQQRQESKRSKFFWHGEMKQGTGLFSIPLLLKHTLASAAHATCQSKLHGGTGKGAATKTAEARGGTKREGGSRGLPHWNSRESVWKTTITRQLGGTLSFCFFSFSFWSLADTVIRVREPMLVFL